ncbi:uncharacterized protein LOC123707413 [Pieris brassicae]|uniref:uncharacterized protein LOC123707413 n=1 Tax=Pieris brassicae TaxID=7116 RepID=UPI001E65ECEB|nr:uncharacterized protein LOC123707413 [Pieris brassicae]
MDPRNGNQQVLSKRAKSRNIFTHRKVTEKTVPYINTKGSHRTNSSKLQKPHPSNNVKKQKKPKKLPTTKVQKQQQKAHPDHFFTTPLPMSDNEFNKFLEENNIDVQSVTASLPNYIPFSTHVMHIVSKLKPYKNNIENISKTKNRKHGMKQNNYNFYIQRQRKKRDKISKKNKSLKLSAKPVLEQEITFTPKNKIFIKNYSDVKRSIKEYQSFTAHDVAALEIIVDLKKCSDLNENENQGATSERTINAVVVGEKPKITNAIQVHIALPDLYSETIKRSPESLQVKKVFSAIMASPIDIAYQLHTFEKTTIPSTTIEENKLSPGLYLLVENSNMSDPTAQLILKPMKMDAKSLNLELTTNESLSEPQTTTPYANDDKVNNFVGYKYKRSINWDSIKRLFGHDRVCRCRCKANQTMCNACAASDAVISELIFEFDNLAKYMRDHCTEIQTFFWMNPTGGKKLRESVSRINKSLNDYYKRVKGKCNGRTCKMFSSGIDRRSILHEFTEYKDNGSLTFLMNLVNIANDLENANALGLLYDEQFEKHGQILQDTIDNCLSRVLTKRSDVEKLYSLDKININLICDPSIERGTLNKTVLHSLRNKAKLLNNVDSNNFLNNDVITFKGEKRKRLKDFVKHRFPSKLSKKSFQDMDSNSILSNFNKNNNSINFRQQRKTEPVVNVLLLKNEPSDSQNRNVIHDTVRSLTTVKQYNFSNHESLVHSMGKLFKLLGNPDIKAFTSSHKNNKSSPKTIHKSLLTNNTKHVTRNKSTTNVLHTTKHNKSSNASKAIYRTEKNEIINSILGVTKHFLNKLKCKTDATEHSERHIRNVTIDTYNSDPTDLNSHKISSVTDRDNPTIIILDENSENVGESKNDQINDDDLRSLLFSVLNYNSKVLNDEWVRAANLEANGGIEKNNRGLSISKKSVNNTKKGFVNKLANKFLWSRINDKKKERFQGHGTSTPLKKVDTSNMDKTTDLSKFISLPTFKTKSTAKIGGRKITVCDISSTIGHIINAQKTLTKLDFETYMKNINCYKYSVVPEKFLIKFNRRKKHCKKEALSSSYERWRRDSKMALYEDDELPELDESEVPEDKHIYELHDNKQLFERFIRDDHGLYQQAPRRMKRQSDSTIDMLTNIPPLKPLTDEVFAMTGDSVVLDCYPPGCKQEGKNHFWIADDNLNILANLTRLNMKNIRKADSGVYVCFNNDNMIVRRVKVSVMDVPKFNVVFATVYETSTSCTYNDLRAIQKIGELMSLITCGNFCSIRIDEPVCLKDRKDESYLLRTLTVILPQYPSINCSIECQRNFRSSMSVLYAKNAPILASIPVAIMHYGGSLPEEVKTWTPSMLEHKAFVSHTLRTSDSDGHSEYHLLADTDPGTIHVVVACPAGFFLVARQKICGLCPSDTYSIEGGNSCVRCPDGTKSEPGSAFCHLSLDRLARSIWTDNPCVSLKAIGVMAMIIIILYYLYRHFAKSEKSLKKSKQKQSKCRSARGSTDYGTPRIWNKSGPPLPPLDF